MGFTAVFELRQLFNMAESGDERIKVNGIE